MRSRGAPLRFLAVVTICWIGARVALLWPQTGSLPEAIRAFVPPPKRPAVAPPAPVPVLGALPSLRVARPPLAGRGPPIYLPEEPAALISQSSPTLSVSDVEALLSPASANPAPLLSPIQALAAPDRWSASGWLVARAGRGIGTAPGGGQLGGGQAGVRVAYLVAPRRRISAFGRIAAPLAGKGGEAAIGIDWQPWKAPVRLAIEHRIGLDGTPGGTGAGVTVGVSNERAGFRLEGYGQAGAIARNRIEPYADGAIRITHAFSPRLSLGAGAWGAVQRDAQRLDIGPSATLSLGKVRVSLDWRQRIAGRARPGSGLALTLGGDF